MKRKAIDWKEIFFKHYPYVKDDKISISKFSCIPIRYIPDENYYFFILKVLRLRKKNVEKIPKKYHDAVFYSKYIPIDLYNI